MIVLGEITKVERAPGTDRIRVEVTFQEDTSSLQSHGFMSITVVNPCRKDWVVGSNA
jgi:hypothetical protein